MTVLRFCPLSKKPLCFLNEAGIEYLAPIYTADTHLLEKIVDCHPSVTTLEHICQTIIKISSRKQNES
jgi:hypothetical protein